MLEERRLEYLLTIGVLLVRIEGKVRIDNLLLQFSVIEGNLEVDPDAADVG